MKYAVTVEYTVRREKELTIYAKDESEAEDKACDLVSGWGDDIVDVEVTSIDEDE